MASRRTLYFSPSPRLSAVLRASGGRGRPAPAHAPRRGGVGDGELRLPGRWGLGRMLSGGGAMGAEGEGTENVLGPVAVPAEGLEAGREVVLDEPLVKLLTRSEEH